MNATAVRRNVVKADIYRGCGNFDDPEFSGDCMEARIVAEDNGVVFVLCPTCYRIHKHLLVPGDVGIFRSGCFLSEYRLGGFYDFREADVAIRRRNAELERKRKKKSASESSGE